MMGGPTTFTILL